MGLPILEQKIPITIEWYLKHWSCIVFEEIYGIRRKMTKREMELFWFFFFFFWETFGLGLCSCLLFWFGFGLCCACDTEEDERRKSWSGFYKEGEWVLGRNSEKQLLKSEFLFYNANVLKIMMTWKIVRVSKTSVLYIYIDKIKRLKK